MRAEAAQLQSLTFFKPNFYSLSKPHPVWSCAGANPYEVRKATVQAQMLSGRYRSCWLSRHWSGESGMCSLPTCRLEPTPGTLVHILTECPDLQPARQRVCDLWAEYLADKPHLLSIATKYITEGSQTSQVQFLLDCSVMPEVISLCQDKVEGVLDSLLYLTRTFCFSIHKSRLKLLGKWNCA